MSSDQMTCALEKQNSENTPSNWRDYYQKKWAEKAIRCPCHPRPSANENPYHEIANFCLAIMRNCERASCPFEFWAQD